MCAFLKGKIVFFVTSNINKFNEARLVFKENGISTALLRVKVSEIQEDDIEIVAKTSVVEASKKTKLPVFVEDSGLLKAFSLRRGKRFYKLSSLLLLPCLKKISTNCGLNVEKPFITT